MALSNTTNRVQTAALSGVSGGDIIATFNSRISADTDLKVYEVTTSATTLLTLNSDYTLSKTLSGTLITSASVVASASAVAEGKFADDSVIVVIRETDYQQSSNYEPNAILPADTLENDLDKLAMQTQQLKDDLTRSLRFSSTLTDAPDPNITLTAAERANKILGFNADGSEFAVTQEIGNYRGNWAVGTVYSVRDIVKEPSEASILNNIYICNTSHTAQGSYVTQSDSAKWDLIVDAASAASSASAAADDADDAEKLAINAEDIQYTLSDGATTGYSALHYAAKAAASASGAVNAKNDAETAKGLAEGALTAIRGFYLGAQASDPLVDGNGDPITEGDWYFNTGSNTTRIYNGSSWDVIEALPQALDTTDSPTFAGLDVDNININGNAITSTNTDGNITITPNGTGEVDISKVDIDGGTIDGTTIGGTTPAAGTFTTFTSTGITDNASTTALTIDASGNVGIWASSPATTFHASKSYVTPAGGISSSTIGIFSYNNTASASANVSILSRSSGSSVLQFGNEAIENVANIISSGATPYLAFGVSSSNTTAATERVRIDNSGNVEIKTTNANLILPSGGGIDFGTSTTGSGTVTGGVLDDYEEGTWTPSVASGSISGTSITYTGKYIKVGDMVTITFLANNAAGNIQVSSYVVFSGLPFSLANRASGTVVTEDIDVFGRQGFISTSGASLALSACGSSSGTNNLIVSFTAKISA